MEDQTTTTQTVEKSVSISERGHAKNVANLQKLTLYVSGFGAGYNPVNDLIKIENMQNLFTLADQAVKQVNHLIPPYSVAVGERKVEFNQLNKKGTRLLNAAIAIGLPNEVIENLKTVKRKIDGRRAPGSAKTSDTEDENTETNKISNSQQGFDNKLNNFDRYVEILSNQPDFIPNEPDLQLEHLNATIEILTVKNRRAIELAVPLANARIERNNILYTDVTGVCDVGLTCKNYVKSAFGINSPEYKSIRNIYFTKKV